MTAQYKGILKMMPLNEGAIGDVIPVDTVSNMLIAAGWQRGNTEDKTLKVIHCTTGQLNPITWKEYRSTCNEVFRQYPLQNQLFYPNLKATMSPWWFSVNHTFRHLLPAYCLDMFKKLTGTKPILVRIMRRLEYAIITMQHFGMHEWYFASKNLINLHQSMSEEDQKNSILTFATSIGDRTLRTTLWVFANTF